MHLLPGRRTFCSLWLVPPLYKWGHAGAPLQQSTTFLCRQPAVLDGETHVLWGLEKKADLPRKQLSCTGQCVHTSFSYHRIEWPGLERTTTIIRFQPPAMCRVANQQTRLPRATSSLALNASRDEAFSISQLLLGAMHRGIATPTFPRSNPGAQTGQRAPTQRANHHRASSSFLTSSYSTLNQFLLFSFSGDWGSTLGKGCCAVLGPCWSHLQTAATWIRAQTSINSALAPVTRGPPGGHYPESRQLRALLGGLLIVLAP